MCAVCLLNSQLLWRSRAGPGFYFLNPSRDFPPSLPAATQTWSHFQLCHSFPEGTLGMSLYPSCSLPLAQGRGWGCGGCRHGASWCLGGLARGHGSFLRPQSLTEWAAALQGVRMAAEVLAAGLALTAGEGRRVKFKSVWGAPRAGGRLAQGFSLAACAGGVGCGHVFGRRTLFFSGKLQAWQGEAPVSSVGNDAGGRA